MKKYFLLLPLFVLPALYTAAQDVGDYRTNQSGDFDNINIWERYKGNNTWEPAPAIPDFSVGNIHILANHIITSGNDRIVDQLTINYQGGLIITAGVFTINDGSGNDVFCQGAMKLSGGTYTGSGSTFVFAAGNLIWEAGTIDTKILSDFGGVIDIDGTGEKNLFDHLTVQGNSVLNWNAGDINCNNANIQINGALFNQFSDGKLINIGVPNTSTVTNEGTVYIAPEKTLAIENMIWNFYARSSLTGRGNFSASASTVNINTQDFTIPETMTFSMTGLPTDLKGTGLMVVNGVFNFNTGHIQIPVTVAAGGIFRMDDPDNKLLSDIIDVSPGAFLEYLNGNLGGINAAINIEGTMEIGPGNKSLVSGATDNSSLNILPGGQVIKSGTGNFVCGWQFTDNGELLILNDAAQRFFVLRKQSEISAPVIINGANTYFVIDGLTAATTTTFNNGTVFDGGGNVDLRFGTIKIGDPPASFASVTNGTTVFLNGGITEGNGELRFAGNTTFNYVKGTLGVNTEAEEGVVVNVYTPDGKTITKTLHIKLGATANFSGPVNLTGANSNIEIEGKAFFNDGAGFGGDGSVVVSGTTTIPIDVTVNFAAGTTLNLSAGTIVGGGLLYVDGIYYLQEGHSNVNVHVNKGARAWMKAVAADDLEISKNWIIENGAVLRVSVEDIRLNNADITVNGTLQTDPNSQISFVNTGAPNTSTFNFTGPIDISAGSSFNATPGVIVNFNPGANFLGTGIFDASGGNDVFINIAPLTIPPGFTFKLDGDPPTSLQGTGSIIVSGLFFHNSGENNIPTTVGTGGSYELNTPADKYLPNMINCKEAATVKWTDGNIYGLNTAINIEGTAEISGGDKTLFAVPGSVNSINILPGGKLIKVDPGILTSNWNLIHGGESLEIIEGVFVQRNGSDISGPVTVNGSNSSIEFASIDPFDKATFNSGMTVSGDGNMKAAGGVVDFNAQVTIPDLFTFFLNGATAQGTGPLIVEGTFDYLNGDLKVPVEIKAGGIANINTADVKNFYASLLVKEGGGLNVSGGPINLHNTTLEIDGVVTTVSDVNINSSTGNNQITVDRTGAVRLNGGGFTTDANFTLDGLLSGFDPFIFNHYGAGVYVTTGDISPGQSPGILTVNTVSPLFSNTSKLNIEIKDGTVPGTGHDQLRRDGDLILDGTLNVTQTGSVPLSAFIIISLNSGTISGSFDVVNLPPGYTIGQTATTVFVSKVALPLHLLSFTARAKENRIELYWETTSEENTSHFEIERSKDGNWYSAIGRLTAAGNSAVQQNYQFTDGQPLSGNNFYRLKMIDRDGRFTYSKIVKVDFEKAVIVRVMPNPANDYIFIEGANLFSAVEIIDQGGKIVRRLITTASPQQYSIEGLQAGLYLLRLRNERETRVIKFIRQ